MEESLFIRPFGFKFCTIFRGASKSLPGVEPAFYFILHVAQSQKIEKHILDNAPPISEIELACFRAVGGGEANVALGVPEEKAAIWVVVGGWHTGPLGAALSPPQASGYLYPQPPRPGSRPRRRDRSAVLVNGARNGRMSRLES